jgi:hypothetical protein
MWPPTGLEASPEQKPDTLFEKQASVKRAIDVVQGVERFPSKLQGPEFKFQYWKKKKRFGLE